MYIYIYREHEKYQHFDWLIKSAYFTYGVQKNLQFKMVVNGVIERAFKLAGVKKKNRFVVVSVRFFFFSTDI